MTHEERMNDPEYALTRVTDYLTREVLRVQSEWRNAKVTSTVSRDERIRRYKQWRMDLTDAAVIIMARRADMALERRRREGR